MSVGPRVVVLPSVAANVRRVPGEGPDSTRSRRFAPRPVGETPLQLVGRIADAYGLVLLLILTTFVVTMTLPPQGWGGRVVAVAVAGLTAIIALTSSDVRFRRVRFATGAALAGVVTAALSKSASSETLLGVAFIIDSLLLAVTILRRVVDRQVAANRVILSTHDHEGGHASSDERQRLPAFGAG
jgi:hypothetical protein